jgi:acyl carrier protein
MTREEVFERVRDYLATELQVDADLVDDGTRFKDDLNADSLHLVELLVELEDSYGIRIPDDEAAKMETVGAVVDFVAARVPEKAS